MLNVVCPLTWKYFNLFNVEKLDEKFIMVKSNELENLLSIVNKSATQIKNSGALIYTITI